MMKWCHPYGRAWREGYHGKYTLKSNIHTGPLFLRGVTHVSMNCNTSLSCGVQVWESSRSRGGNSQEAWPKCEVMMAFGTQAVRELSWSSTPILDISLFSLLVMMKDSRAARSGRDNNIIQWASILLIWVNKKLTLWQIRRWKFQIRCYRVIIRQHINPKILALSP